MYTYFYHIYIYIYTYIYIYIYICTVYIYIYLSVCVSICYMIPFYKSLSYSDPPPRNEALKLMDDLEPALWMHRCLKAKAFHHVMLGPCLVQPWSAACPVQGSLHHVAWSLPKMGCFWSTAGWFAGWAHVRRSGSFYYQRSRTLPCLKGLTSAPELGVMIRKFNDSSHPESLKHMTIRCRRWPSSPDWVWREGFCSDGFVA